MLLEPALPPHQRQTYSILAPRSTHFRPATCEEVDCPDYLNGFRATIDERTDLGKAQAYYIRRESGRGFSEQHDEQGRTVFTFHAGQTCFNVSDHQLRLDRPELYVIRGGDHRGNPRGDVRRMSGPTPWVDDFGEHQQRLADKMKEG